MHDALETAYTTGIHEIFWGGTLVAVTMGLHAFGMLLVLRMTGALRHRFEPKPSFSSGMFILVLASWMILVVHLFEVFSWAGFFYWKGAVNSQNANPSLCYYFALMDYTTLGSNYNLKTNWRLLEGMIAVAGLLTFAWSTGVLFTLAQDFQEQQMQLLKQRRERHHAKNPDAAPRPAGEAKHE